MMNRVPKRLRAARTLVNGAALMSLAWGVAACGGDDPVGATGLPDVIGTFAGEWELIRIRFGPSDTTTIKTCGGAITLDDQQDEFFFGDFGVQPDTVAGCIEVVGAVEGKVFEDGSIQIVTLNPDEIEVFIGCPANVFGNAFGGSQRNDNLFLVRDDVFGACPGGLTQFVLLFEGQR
jgi:hypothetical protein